MRSSRFTRFPVSSTWSQRAWIAKRHGDFQRRFDYIKAAGPSDWPFSCRYFEPLIMDASEAMDLNVRDTEYMEDGKPVSYIDFTDAGPVEKSIALDDEGVEKLGNLDNLPCLGTRVLFLPQWRVYSTTRSTIQLSIRSTTWESLLQALMIPPNMVEMLHDNNGGSWHYISHCGDTCRSSKDHIGHTGPCAYHICFKASQFELMYARHDYHSKRNLVLIMGFSLELEIQRLTSQFKDLQTVHLFHILLAILSTWLRKLEESRWSLDFDVLQLEQDIGFGQLFRNIKSQQREQLSELRNGTAGTQGWIRSIVRHSLCIGEHFRILAEELRRFQALQDSQDEILTKKILDAICQCKIQQESQAVQARDLSWRIGNLWNVLVTLMSKHDSDVIITMAQDARVDSLLMRRMATVSIIFLPATFLATFFSMMFFQVEQSGALIINKHIWVYFVSTCAMSVFIGLYFRFGRKCRTLSTTTLKQTWRRLQPRGPDNLEQTKA